MDPNATYQAAIEALVAGDAETATDLIESLLHWLEKGGFPPRT